jgi:TRAP-type C4-dicarboxylate transport system permease small subunit
MAIMRQSKPGEVRFYEIGAVHKIENVCMIVASIALFLMMALTTLDVILRSTMSAPLPGLIEFVEEYLMISCIFLPISYLYVRGGHVRVEMLDHFFPKIVKHIIDILADLVAVVLFGFIAYINYPVIVRNFTLNITTNAILRYPMWPAYLILVIGNILMVGRAMQVMIMKLNGSYYK